MTFDNEAPTLYLNVDGALGVGRVKVDARPGLHKGALVGVDCDKPAFEFAHVFAELIRPYPVVQVVISLAWIRLLPSARVNSRLPGELLNRIVMCSSIANHDECKLVDGTADPRTIIRHATDFNVKRWLALQNTSFPIPKRYEQNFVTTDDMLGVNCPEIQAFLRAWMNNARQASEQARKVET
ncbi:HAD domain-containing protein [Paraburkholderia caribensis]|uniref:hypothetical protein n=1 Tax=Paraburkholderia caribensis TaxID=75105 RepID=UPI0015925A2F|nr:hypothetical protein [Paraburkholderia caribensis]